MFIRTCFLKFWLTICIVTFSTKSYYFLYISTKKGESISILIILITHIKHYIKYFEKTTVYRSLTPNLRYFLPIQPIHFGIICSETILHIEVTLNLFYMIYSKRVPFISCLYLQAISKNNDKQYRKVDWMIEVIPLDQRSLKSSKIVYLTNLNNNVKYIV